MREENVNSVRINQLPEGVWTYTPPARQEAALSGERQLWRNLTKHFPLKITNAIPLKLPIIHCLIKCADNLVLLFNCYYLFVIIINCSAIVSFSLEGEW